MELKRFSKMKKIPKSCKSGVWRGVHFQNRNYDTKYISPSSSLENLKPPPFILTHSRPIPPPPAPLPPSLLLPPTPYGIQQDGNIQLGGKQNFLTCTCCVFDDANNNIKQKNPKSRHLGVEKSEQRLATVHFTLFYRVLPRGAIERKGFVTSWSRGYKYSEWKLIFQNFRCGFDPGRFLVFSVILRTSLGRSSKEYPIGGSPTGWRGTDPRSEAR